MIALSSGDGQIDRDHVGAGSLAIRYTGWAIDSPTRAAARCPSLSTNDARNEVGSHRRLPGQLLRGTWDRVPRTMPVVLVWTESVCRRAEISDLDLVRLGFGVHDVGQPDYSRWTTLF